MHKTPADLQEAEIEERPENAELDQADEHAVGADEVPRFLNAVADSRRGARQLRRYEAEERKGATHAQASHDMWRRGRHHDFEKLARAASAERTRGPDVGLGHARRPVIGVEPNPQE